MKHFGRSAAVGFRDEHLEHLAKVNGWGTATAEHYVDLVMAWWLWRSSFEDWSLDLEALSSYGVEVPAAPRPEKVRRVLSIQRAAEVPARAEGLHTEGETLVWYERVSGCPQVV
ncbi:MAG TPA: hypothetical protein VK988_09150 [Acidimicrobiales bacterium]|nr:hypothetical protein [Acidimicrobiales bacterium]